MNLLYVDTGLIHKQRQSTTENKVI